MKSDPIELHFTSQDYEKIFKIIGVRKAEFVEELIRICQIPAPTFRERQRAQYFASLFDEMGTAASIDAVGNVQVPVLKKERPHVVLSAHLDTVFSLETIRVTRKGKVLHAPGISDDSAGLAAMVVLARTLLQSSIPFQGSLTLLATVGEEGLGNLRGVKHFFKENGDNVDFFISLDGSDAERLVIRGLASKRIRVILRGPGGHSWGDAGTANPIHAAGDMLSRIHRVRLSSDPKTTLNVGIIQGGTSINAIPAEVALDIDLRSEAKEALQKLDAFLTQVVSETTHINPDITSEIRILGERPAGSISPEHLLVQSAIAANRELNLPAKLESGSTDSNIPFSLGIPAITIGVGGKSGKIHTQEEWYDVTDAERGLKRTALLIAELLNQRR